MATLATPLTRVCGKKGKFYFSNIKGHVFGVAM